VEGKNSAVFQLWRQTFGLSFREWACSVAMVTVVEFISLALEDFSCEVTHLLFDCLGVTVVDD
jgi:hypothetical protein